MAGLFSKIMRFAKSPEGRRAINQAKRYAKDPHARKQAKNTFDRLRGKKGHGGHGGRGY